MPSSEDSINFYLTSTRYNLEESNLHSYRSEDFRSPGKVQNRLNMSPLSQRKQAILLVK
jgi:hypothetical protein